MPKFSVAPQVKAVAQETEMSCWAAVLSMLHNWKNPGVQKTPKQLAKEGGQDFLLYYDRGLPHSANPAYDKFGDLVLEYGLKPLPLQTYSLEQWKSFLEKYGPLGILADGAQDGDRYTHLLLMQGIEWQAGFDDAIFHIVDPNGGLIVPTNAKELQTRLDAKDVVSLASMKGWCYP